MSGAYFVSGSDTDSGARLNQKTITSDTGTNLAALANTYPNQMIISQDTSGPFLANTVYIRNTTNTSWLQLSPPLIHNHSTNTNADGGLLSDVQMANTGQLVYLNYPAPRAANFWPTIVTSGTVTDNIAANQWRVNLNTGATTSAVAQADVGGIKIDFGSKIKFQAKIEQQTLTTSLQARMGVNIESAGSAVSLTTKSLGFEFCDSTGTTYQLVSCDGGGLAGSRTVTNTTQPFNGLHGIKFQYTPATSIVGTVDQTVATTKVSNLPNSGAADADKSARFGITLSNVGASTTTAKNLYVYGFVVVGVDNDVGWN